MDLVSAKSSNPVGQNTLPLQCEPRQRMSDKEAKSKVLVGSSINACTYLPGHLDNVRICARPDLPSCIFHPHMVLIKRGSQSEVPKREPLNEYTYYPLLFFPFDYGVRSFDSIASLSEPVCVTRIAPLYSYYLNPHGHCVAFCEYSFEVTALRFCIVQHKDSYSSILCSRDIVLIRPKDRFREDEAIAETRKSYRLRSASVVVIRKQTAIQLSRDISTGNIEDL